jgi:hypothetical protein
VGIDDPDCLFGRFHITLVNIQTRRLDSLPFRITVSMSISSPVDIAEVLVTKSIGNTSDNTEKLVREPHNTLSTNELYVLSIQTSFSVYRAVMLS